MVDRRRDDGHGNLQCSFCGKSQKEVKKLIAGPTVYICDECIGLCNDIIAEEVEREESLTTTAPLPKPAECGPGAFRPPCSPLSGPSAAPWWPSPPRCSR